MVLDAYILLFLDGCYRSAAFQYLGLIYREDQAPVIRKHWSVRWFIQTVPRRFEKKTVQFILYDFVVIYDRVKISDFFHVYAIIAGSFFLSFARARHRS